MYGGTGSWYFSTLAGLRRAPGSRSWSDLVIAPPAPGSINNNLTWANASIDTPIGIVRSAWSVAGGAGDAVSHTLHAIVPPNARGRVVIPAVAAALAAAFVVAEGGSVVWADGHYAGAVAGIMTATLAEVEGGSGAVVFEVGSGSYVFTSCCHAAGTT